MKYRFYIFFAAGFGVMLAAGWVGFPRTLYRSERQPLDFNHRIHKDKASEKCTDCHSVSADGVFMGIPSMATCAVCHADPIGSSTNEKVFVASWVKTGREIPWRSYGRQPMNVRFSHAVHLNLGKVACETCHGPHGDSTSTAMYQEDRISGYSRNPVSMTMSDCEDCHRQRGVGAGCLGCHK
jgi:hypothetical protein